MLLGGLRLVMHSTPNLRLSACVLSVCMLLCMSNTIIYVEASSTVDRPFDCPIVIIEAAATSGLLFTSSSNGNYITTLTTVSA